MPNPHTDAMAGSPRTGLSLRRLFLILTPIITALFLAAKIGDFDPAPLPAGFDSPVSSAAEVVHREFLSRVGERLGDGLLPGPEDLAFDEKNGFLYTSCSDGWIRRFRQPAEGLKDVEVEDWLHVGGRPLGVAISPDGSILVAESYKGLLKASKDGNVNLLVDEAEGLKFKLTDGVVVSSDGLIYFTDASHKYNVDASILDFLEGRPNGRLISYDPSNNQTTVLARDLYFANGVSFSHDRLSLIFCETLLRRCMRYHMKGEKKGEIEKFVENLPGYPDNIHYDGEGHYWIALFAMRSKMWDLAMRHPLLRKYLMIIAKLAGGLPLMESGVLSVNLEGRLKSLFVDRGLYQVTSALKVGKRLYLGSLTKPYVLTLDLSKFS